MHIDRRRSFHENPLLWWCRYQLGFSFVVSAHNDSPALRAFVSCYQRTTPSLCALDIVVVAGLCSSAAAIQFKNPLLLWWRRRRIRSYHSCTGTAGNNRTFDHCQYYVWWYRRRLPALWFICICCCIAGLPGTMLCSASIVGSGCPGRATILTVFAWRSKA
jgi:hypothetical protein